MTLNIIIGPNRVEYIQVKKRDMKKHWFSHREQMYMTYPEHRLRIDMTDEKGFIRSETFIAYPENGSRPYFSGPLPTEKDKVKTDPFSFSNECGHAYEHKLSQQGKFNWFGRAKIYYQEGRSFWRAFGPWFPLIVGMIILGLSFTGVLN